MKKKDYSGYIEPFYNGNKEYYENAIALNAARYCISEHIQAAQYNKVYCPYYMCQTLLDELESDTLCLYQLDREFMPIIKAKLSPGDLIIYPNFFGIFDQKCEDIIRRFTPAEVLLDNTQAFYHFSKNATAICYSPRKFFEVTDGGYLITNQKINISSYKKDFSAKRYQALLLRCEEGASAGYGLHLEGEKEITQSGPMRMSNLTKRILGSIDYENVRTERKKNFEILHHRLKSVNEIDIPSSIEFSCPMIYPFLTKNEGLSNYLVQNQIFVPKWWKTVQDIVPADWFEAELSKYLVPLPIDQRYGAEDMEYIAKVVMQEVEK